MKVLLGKKLGMSQAFDSKTGEVTPVTVIDISGNVVARHLKEGGDAVTHIEIGRDAVRDARASDKGNYKNIKFVPKFKKAFKVKSDEEIPDIASELKADIFKTGDVIDVSGVSKGKGFTGVMKRWNFKGGKRTHGQSDRERAPGSIGSGTTPGRVLKGKKMPGRIGRETQTIKNLKIVDIDTKNEIITVSGAVPGFNGSYLIIKEAKYAKNQ
jgi:large subunit ribosomal protein L3